MEDDWLEAAYESLHEGDFPPDDVTFWEDFDDADYAGWE